MCVFIYIQDVTFAFSDVDFWRCWYNQVTREWMYMLVVCYHYEDQGLARKL